MPSCQNCKKDFVITEEDRAFYRKIEVPEPTWCPQCRMIRRLAFRRTRYLYRRSVVGYDKEVLTPFRPDSGITVYHSDLWNSDKWDARDYARDYDFSRPFFEQFKELMREVPWPHGWNKEGENSEYSNDVTNLRNCYLTFNSGWSEDCYYGNEFLKSRKSMDCTNVRDCQLCYQCIDCEKCFHCIGCQDCTSCTDVYYSYNLRDCQNCVGCVNLKHKSYCIFNEQYTKETYEKKLKELQLDTSQGIVKVQKQVDSLRLQLPQRYMHGVGNEDVTGDYVNHSKNTKESFICNDLEDCKYNQYILFLRSKECYDITVAGGELCYELEEAGGYNVKFSFVAVSKSLNNGVLEFRDAEYVANCEEGHDMFGCVGIKSGKYCILNKQYSKEEYFKLREKIVNHMNEMPYIDSLGREYRYGEFLPPDLALTPYQETLAQEYFPLTDEEIKAHGFNWSEQKEREVVPTLKLEKISTSIADVPNSITQELLECSHGARCVHGCTKAFKIIPQELSLYREMNLPLPKTCHNCRHHERIGKRNPLELHHRQCTCELDHRHPGKRRCSNEFETTFALDRPEKVYCETCFQQVTE